MPRHELGHRSGYPGLLRKPESQVDDEGGAGSYGLEAGSTVCGAVAESAVAEDRWHTTGTVLPLERGTKTCGWAVRGKSRMSREAQVRFCESVRVKSSRATRQ